MSQMYREGETRVRPDVYYRYTKKEDRNGKEAIDGTNALIMKAPWGPTSEVVGFTEPKNIRETYGDCIGVKMAEAIFAEGATKVYIFRVGGEGGSKGTLQQGENLMFTAKHEGNYPVKIKVQKTPGNSTKQCMIIVENMVKESFFFDVDELDETEQLMEQLKNSQYVTLEVTGTGTIPEFEDILEGGQDSAATPESYSEGLYALEPYYYNVICCDTVEDTVQELLAAYVEEAAKSGKYSIAVVGTEMNITLEERKAKAKAFNQSQVAFVGSTYKNREGEIATSSMVVAHLAGAIAATPSNQSIIHKTIEGAEDVAERFTNVQYEDAASNGMILLSKSADGQVWFDSGVTTLVIPAENQDGGWTKLKRVKVRNELMHRLDVLMEKKIGRINCDADGIADAIQTGMGLLTDMENEKKFYSGGKFALDVDQAPTNDSAWFTIEVDDVDTLEKIYLHYGFRNIATA